MSIAETLIALPQRWAASQKDRAVTKEPEPEFTHYRPGEKPLFDSEQTKKLIKQIQELSSESKE